MTNLEMVAAELDAAKRKHPFFASELIDPRAAIAWSADEDEDKLMHDVDRLRAELSDKTRNYEDVIAHHQRAEEHLRGLIKRLITVREKVFWRKDEKTGMTYETCLMDEDEARKTIEEAKAAIKEDKE